MMLSCKDTSRLVSEAMEKELPLLKRIHVRMHLLLCPPCNRYKKQIGFLRGVCQTLLRELFDGLTDPVQLPDEARERLKQALKGA